MVLSLYGSKEEQRIDASIVLRISQKNELREIFRGKARKKGNNGSVKYRIRITIRNSIEFLIIDQDKLDNISFVSSVTIIFGIINLPLTCLLIR